MVHPPLADSDLINAESRAQWLGSSRAALQGKARSEPNVQQSPKSTTAPLHWSVTERPNY
jgi:hypothetical protein